MMEMISRRRKNEKTAEQIGPESEALDLLIAERNSMVTMSSVVWTLASASLRSLKELGTDVGETVRVEDMTMPRLREATYGLKRANCILESRK